MSEHDTYSVVPGWPQLPAEFELEQITGVDFDSHGHLFIISRADALPAPPALIAAAPILRMDAASGEILSSWGENRFLRPHGLRVDHDDNVWVTDIRLHQVFEFSQDGELLRTLGTERTAGLGAGHFDGPTDIAFAPDGSFYVSDGYGNNRIAKFSSDGEFLLDWGSEGVGPSEFRTPHGIRVDAQGLVYVADRTNACIQVFGAEGEFVEMWKSDELGRPWNLAIGPDNLLYVVDGGDIADPPDSPGRLLKLDFSGNILATWSRFGSYDGERYFGHDLTVGMDGSVYVGVVYPGDVWQDLRLQKFVSVPIDVPANSVG